MTDDILRALREEARAHPERLALISPRGSLSVEQLERHSSACARGLAHLGLKEGQHVALMVTPGVEFLITAFALLKLGCPMVLIDPGIGLDHLGNCLREAEPEAFIGVPLAQLARIWLGWGEETIRLTVSSGRCWGLADYSLREVLEAGAVLPETCIPERSPDHVVAIAFTSGSTGPPKGVIYTHRMFRAQVKMLRDRYGIEPGEIDLATFPLFGLFDVGWGTTTVFPDMDFSAPGQVDAEMIVRTIQNFRVTHMFGSPALLDRVSRWAVPREIQLRTVRRVLSAGAPVSPAILQRFRKLLPIGSDVHTPYGATEALPVSTITAGEVLEERGWEKGSGVCVGRPFENLSLKILPVSDLPLERWSSDAELPVDKVGEITVSGPNVSPGYYNRPESDRQAKIRTDDGFWHRMGDLGYLDEEGRVWFCGRKSHRVQCGSTTLFSVQVEGVYNGHPDVFRSALIGIGKKPDQHPVLCVELEPDSRRLQEPELVSEILALGEGHAFGPLIDTVLFHEAFPVDIRHNAKIFREELALWAEKRLTGSAKVK